MARLVDELAVAYGALAVAQQDVLEMMRLGDVSAGRLAEMSARVRQVGNHLARLSAEVEDDS